MQALAPKGAFATSQITIQVGDTLEPRSLIERLVSAGYERVEMVEGRGQCAPRAETSWTCSRPARNTP